MPTEIFPGRFESLARISEFVKQAAKKAGFGQSDTYAIQLAVDEACSNIVEHAYGGEDLGVIECTCDANNAGLTIILRDYGHAFNPANVPEPKIDTPLEDVKRGGAGLFLIRKMMDEVYFMFSPEKGNELKMVKKKKKA